ncbi:MAG: DNA polymerase III subunit delta' [Bacteroidia bacterium]|nr:DNA polymerase III subunit delta' [Bacteroidia bacterium]
MKFSEVIGQEAAKTKILEAIANNRLAHALILTGPAGIGKLALATAIAQYVNCLQPTDGDSCGKCTNCIKIKKGIHPDVKYVLPIISKTEGGRTWLTEDYFEPFRESFFNDPYLGFSQWQRTLDGENKQLFISVHEIRELKRKIYLKAFEAPYKVVILWNTELLHTSGANAFLKLLEEPPDKTLLILTCSDPARLIATINSRCQRIHLSRVSREDIQRYLMEKRGLDAPTAGEFSAIAEGSIGNASEFLSETSQTLTDTYIEWLRAAYTGNYEKISDQLEKIYKESKEFQKLFLEVSVRKMRDSLLFHLGIPDIAPVTESEKAFHQKFGQIVSPEKVERISEEMEKSLRQIGGNANPQLVFTALSLRMHQILRS